jgi:hypothetical protein
MSERSRALANRQAILAEPIDRTKETAELERLAEAMLPFLREIGTEARKYRVDYNRRAVIMLIRCLREGYFMRAVERAPDLPYDVKIMASHATTGMAKMGRFATNAIEHPDFQAFVAMAWVMRDKIDQILAFLEVDAQKRSQMELAAAQR